jgi:glycosyltransferase involved in cell wall biosynthesis
VAVTELAQNVTPGRQMAANPTSAFGVELRDVDDVHSLLQSPSAADLSVAPVGLPSEARKRVSSGGAAARISALHRELGDAAAAVPAELSPFAALAARHGRPLRIAILSDFLRIPYANGAVFQTRFLYQELRRYGHEVTVFGPADPAAAPGEIAPGSVPLPSVSMPAYPGLRVPLPLASWIFEAKRWDFDVCFAQTTTMLLEFGIWLRQMKGTPLLCVNTTHLVAAYDELLPARLAKIGLVHAGLHLTLKRPYERLFARLYNQSDGLVVLSDGLKTYWRECGVTVPIHVIPRTVQPEVFDRPLGSDPYTDLLANAGLSDRGPRLVCAGRHTREKSQDRVIRIFAQHVLPKEPDATLTLVGEGAETAELMRLTRELGADRQVLFTGEVSWTAMPDYYRFADIFIHASLSETYGNVVGEALWCGTPMVAFADGMGVSSQITDGVNGLLLSPGKGEVAESAADAAFGRAVVDLVRHPTTRARLGKNASKRARERCAPAIVQGRIAEAFQHAQEHAVACGERPAVERPKVMQWLTTWSHARSWTTYNGMVVLAGCLRPVSRGQRSKMHPSIGG